MSTKFLVDKQLGAEPPSGREAKVEHEIDHLQYLGAKTSQFRGRRRAILQVPLGSTTAAIVEREPNFAYPYQMFLFREKAATGKLDRK